MPNFTHLHVHTQYSILDGAANVDVLLARTKELGMNSIAITDHGNMFGVKYFHEAAKKAGVKPLLGVEAYVARRSRHDKSEVVDRNGNHLVIIAKNEVGYKNLTRLASFAFIEGYYYKPRIDKELLQKYKEGLIICSACLGGEIPQKIMRETIEAAEESALWFKNTFGDDYYLEMQLHKTEDPVKNKDIYDNQVMVNEAILKIGKKHGIKVIATNDVHFTNKEDAEAHDRLICLNTGKDLDDPTRMRYTMQEYLKSPEEMAELFPDNPEALEITQEIANKVEEFELDCDPIMPDFPLPDGFETEDDYLKHITYEGAIMRYGAIEGDVKERIDFELDTIKNMGFPGYFLIVWDFIKAARDMGVLVGPGRGSAAGSAVAYSLQITNLDPIKYDLLFERFLNPDRISMPDIDIDFDDDGRQQVLDWVVEKYGYEKVAHIVTFGKMAAKLALRDIARVQKVPLDEADRLCKALPDKPGIKLGGSYQVIEGIEKKNGGDFSKVYKTIDGQMTEARKASNDKLLGKLEIQKIIAEEVEKARQVNDSNKLDTLSYACTLEGSVRQTGVHACGIIIGKNNLYEDIPVSTNKDADLLVTQYDGKFVESVGMLKMDFLGLRTLSIIKECLANIKLSKGIDIDIDNVALDDVKTFELYSRGDTTAIFQFESEGMKKYLRELKPNRFEDLVAMNALYRPGPMEYIPSYVARKFGIEKVAYDHPLMEEYLEETYGITVFQEQVMLLSRKLAGFTRGQSDSLRKAMGKKKMDLMMKLKELFIAGCKENPKFMEALNGKDPDVLIEKIWKDWEAFASYAFNKSHSVCYAYVSYQTAYLKAHYPAEFMAAVMSRNLSDIKKITIFMDECKRMGMKVLGPDVNESYHKFTVNKQGAVRFGMAAIKGVGEGAVMNIIETREKKGLYGDMFDFLDKMNFSAVNKKVFENLAKAGGFDCFPEIKRHQYFATDEKGATFLETLVKYGNNIQAEKSKGANLFGDAATLEIPKPQIPEAEEWSELHRLNLEKELIGIYLSAHPLDSFKFEFENFTNTTLSQLNADLTPLDGRELRVGGLVSSVIHRTTRTGKPMGSFVLEDFSDSYNFVLFSKDYMQFKNFLTEGYFLFVNAKVQRRFGQEEGDLTVRITGMKMLHDVKEQMVKKLAIKLPLEKITPELIESIDKIAESHKGSTGLEFLVFDPSSKIWVQMASSSHKIDVSNDLISEIERTNLDYKIFN